MTDNCILAAVINNVVPDNMRADLFFGPANTFSAKNRFQLVLISGLVPPDRTIEMSGRFFFTNTDSAAFSIMNNIVLYYPALTPVLGQSVPGDRLWEAPTGVVACAISNPLTVM